MNTECPSSDIISTLPENIIETILSLMPIRDALRTSILSKKWQYSWRNMPKLEFTYNMAEEPLHHGSRELKKYKHVNAIFHVLLLHNGPRVLKFNYPVCQLNMDSEFLQIMSYLARGNKVKEVIFFNDNFSYKLPISFFSLQELELIHLESCTFEPPLTFNGFSRLKSMKFMDVEVSAQVLQRFLSKCPLLEQICLNGIQFRIDFVAGGNKFTFVDLLQCVPLIRSLDISKYYTKYLSGVGMPHKLPSSPVHLKHLFLEVCLMEQNEMFSALCMIRSSPVLEKVTILMCDNDVLPVRQTPANFLDPENHSDLTLDYLEILEIEMFRNLPLEMIFVKLFMAKSPVLKKVQIKLHYRVSVGEELKMLRDLVRLPLPRASPSAELIIKRL